MAPVESYKMRQAGGMIGAFLKHHALPTKAVQAPVKRGYETREIQVRRTIFLKASSDNVLIECSEDQKQGAYQKLSGKGVGVSAENAEGENNKSEDEDEEDGTEWKKLHWNGPNHARKVVEDDEKEVKSFAMKVDMEGKGRTKALKPKLIEESPPSPQISSIIGQPTILNSFCNNKHAAINHRFFDASSFRLETKYYHVRENNPFIQAAAQRMTRKELLFRRPSRLRAKENPAADDHLRPCHRGELVYQFPKTPTFERGTLEDLNRRLGEAYTLAEVVHAFRQGSPRILSSITRNVRTTDKSRYILSFPGKKVIKKGMPASQKELRDRQLMPPPKLCTTQLRVAKAQAYKT